MITLLLVLVAIACHFGLRVAIYNRVNALGWRRRTIKRIVKITFVEMWITLLAMAWQCHDAIGSISRGDADWNAVPIAWLIYGSFCLVLGTFLGVLWLWWRPIFGVEHVRLQRRVRVEIPDQQQKGLLARSKTCGRAIRIPFNQILDLSIDQIDLPIPRLPKALVGYRIAHLSDIHLTGHVQPEFISNVISHANSFDPEMFALSGDIVDAQECVGWLEELFSPARAHDGCYFILGNHDTRVGDAGLVREAMQSAGWRDAGGKSEWITCRETQTALLGNESPWFARPSDAEIESMLADRNTSADHDTAEHFRLCVSHSPDQFDWARKHDVDLMLCGHTHGGQGRLPLAGPILSPSWHGSRWASGDFYRSPTTMHVSRGLGGVHLLRINCRPELSLITLRQAR